jgi:hypothetical protein
MSIIEKNIPLPKKEFKIKDYPFDKLQKGESIDLGIEFSKEEVQSIKQKLKQYYKRWNKNYDLIVDKCPKSENSTRVWRV